MWLSCFKLIYIGTCSSVMSFLLLIFKCVPIVVFNSGGFSLGRIPQFCPRCPLFGDIDVRVAPHWKLELKATNELDTATINGRICTVISLYFASASTGLSQTSGLCLWTPLGYLCLPDPLTRPVGPLWKICHSGHCPTPSQQSWPRPPRFSRLELPLVFKCQCHTLTR